MGPVLYTAKNWCGYAAESSLGAPLSNSVSAVSGSWIVPAVTRSSNAAANAQGLTSDCAVWVGMDGFSNDTVEQIGTNSYVENGVSLYYAWYEMYPGEIVPIDGLGGITVKPGDSITASVQYGVPSDPGQFQLSITDNTSVPVQTYTISQSNSTAFRTSAEWIVEAPSTTSILPLPTFSPVTFTGATATIGGTTGPIDDYSAWQVAQINMSNTAWNNAMTASAVTDDSSGATSSFSVVGAPEPSALALLAAAATVASGGRGRRRRDRGMRDEG